MVKLTRKQKGFVKDYVETGNGTISALNNYDIESNKPEKVASVIATENLAKPSIQKAIADMLPDDLLNTRHLELLNKRELISKVLENGDLKSHDLGPDVQAVSKGLDMAYKIKGSYAPEKTQNVNVNVEVTPKVKELSDKFNEELKKEILG